MSSSNVKETSCIEHYSTTLAWEGVTYPFNVVVEHWLHDGGATDEWVAICEVTPMWGGGATGKEAEDDLIVKLKEAWTHLHSGVKLTPRLKALLHAMMPHYETPRE